MRLTARHPAAFSLESHQPLYERAPARDEDGLPVTDFMVLIPGLRGRSDRELNEMVVRLQWIIARCHDIVFVDLNVRLNLLWVSVRPRPGVILELFDALKCEVPEAKLVGPRYR